MRWRWRVAPSLANGNACIPPCAACIPVGQACGGDMSGFCCGGAPCDDGVCQPVPNGLLACDASLLNPQSECTQQPRTGVCIDGVCNCGLGGEYDRANNTCVCNAESTEQCRGCCQVSFVCADGTTLTTCGTCASE